MSDISLVASLMGLAPGAVGGVCSVFVGHPIDLIKVRMQVGTIAPPPSSGIMASASRRILARESSTSTVGMLRHIFVQEGVPGLYRGVQAPLLAVTPAFAVSFWSYDFAKRIIADYNHIQPGDSLNLSQVALAGGFSGLPLAAIIGPTERIKCLMQVDRSRYHGFLHCFQSVYHEGGLRSVVRGTASTALRDVPGNAAYFGTYEYIKRFTCQLEGRENASTTGILIAGGSAGIANWIVAIPFDTIKSRWQTSPMGKYKNLMDVLQTLLREEGPRALFRGISPALLRAFPANAACLCGVETVKTLIEQR